MAMLLANSCGDFVRTNPFDPAVPVTLTLSGPDSTFAQFDTVRFTVTTDPAYDHDPPDWQLSGLLRLDDNGTYQVRQIELYGGKPVQATIAVKIGPRIATKTVNVTFRPTTLRVRNCDDDANQVTFTALESTAWLCYSVFDRRGGIITRDADIAPYALAMRVLDTKVVKQGSSARYITSAGNGSTKVEFSYGPALDTMQFTVRQELRFLSLYPSACELYGVGDVRLSIGDSIQVRAGAPGRDANRQPMADTSYAHDAAEGLTWQLGQWGVPFFQTTIPVTVSPTGWVRAVAPGWGTAQAKPPTSVAGLSWSSCGVTVN
jgi:hypothetical protein